MPAITRRTALAGAGALAVAAIGGRARAAEITLRLGHPLAPSDETQTAMLAYADAVKERSNGKVEIQVFPSDQLAAQKELGEMLVQGADVIQLTDFLFLAQWVPDAGILLAPFLLNEWDDWYKILKSDWWAGMLDRFTKNNIHMLSANAYFGSRSLIGNKEIRTPADIAGENLREANAPMYVEMAKAWGARPVVIAFGEVYTALSQGVVDFVECPPQTMVASKFTELRKIVSLTNHMSGWDAVMMAESTYQKLPEDVCVILDEEGSKAGDLLTKLKRESDEKIVAEMRKMGLTVVEDVDRKAFQKASQPAYDSFTDWTPGLTKTLRDIIDA
jgi:tripartite ATP-independent transporter DctP family solute receptor